MTDRALIDSFTKAVLSGDAGSISDYFAAQDIQPPTFRWNPEAGTLGEAPLEILSRWWLSKRAAGGLPSIDAVDPIELKGALGYLMILDVLEDGWDYRYRLYGTEIARHAKRDYTGQRTSDLKVFSTIPIFYIACYRACSRGRNRWRRTISRRSTWRLRPGPGSSCRWPVAMDGSPASSSAMFRAPGADLAKNP